VPLYKCRVQGVFFLSCQFLHIYTELFPSQFHRENAK
jgi:hypothetical protein